MATLESHVCKRICFAHTGRSFSLLESAEQAGRWAGGGAAGSYSGRLGFLRRSTVFVLNINEQAAHYKPHWFSFARGDSDFSANCTRLCLL